MIKLYFSDFFDVPASKVESHGAFNISLLTDLPLFIDPFLLFNSEKKQHRELHDEIIRYLKFLREKSTSGGTGIGLQEAWYRFPEIKQTWLGFTVSGNEGLGLGRKFGAALNSNLGDVFRDFGDEQVTKGSHLEKLCLIAEGVGNDKISDFTTNLIHGYLAAYTERFAKKYIGAGKRAIKTIPRVRFNYDTETWEHGRFELPIYADDYVLLTPRELLTKDDTWINRHDLVANFEDIPDAVPNKQLRAQINNYFRKRLPRDPKKKEIEKAAIATIAEFPVLIDAFIRRKEDTGDRARSISDAKVLESDQRYIRQFGQLVSLIDTQTGFYKVSGTTYEESFARVQFFKDVIENKGGHKFFYLNGKAVERESDVHILYRLAWFGTPSDVTREANDGRGPADFKVSRGAEDKTIVEFKLASNSKLRRNLEKQAEIYQRASDAKSSIKVILFFNDAQQRKVRKILKELGLEGNKDVVLIDARSNKPSASKA